MRNIWAVILAGGDGHRLRALTTNARGRPTPKQYCSIDGGRSLLQMALQRASAVTSRKRIVTVVTEAHRRWWEREFLASPYSPLVVQPCNRDTGLGVLLPLLVIAKSDPEAGVVFIPSDHYVEHEEVLAEFLRRATAPEVMDSDRLTVLGMSPNAPDSGFGYLSPAPDSGVGMRPVLEAVRKPAPLSVAALMGAGSAWNSGIVAGRISQFIALYSPHARQMVKDLQTIIEHWTDSRIPSADLAALYARHPALDFSGDVLPKHHHSLQFLNVPPCGWNDVDTPEQLANALGALRLLIADFRFAPMRTFNLATAFDRAALKAAPSPLERNQFPFGPRNFASIAHFPRLAPYDEC